MFATDRSLDVQREEFKRARLIAMPIAGLIVWLIIGILGMFLPTGKAALALFIGTGSIAYLGMFISRFTGEHFLDRSRPTNTFDALFFVVLATALQAYAIAIPFFLVMPSSLPLTVGVLSGMMWLPMSWILQHWIGIVHGGLRTVLVVVAWYMFPPIASSSCRSSSWRCMSLRSSCSSRAGARCTHAPHAPRRPTE